MTSDKAIFYSFCLANAIPIPKLLAIFDLPSGRTPAGQLITTQNDWHHFLRSLPNNFIVKPALGLQGKGVTAFCRKNEGFVDHDGYNRNCKELYEFLCNKNEQNLFAGNYSHHSLKLQHTSNKVIIQEQIYAHPKITELTNSIALCTCRLITYTDNSTKTHILGSAFRVITGDNIIDNLDMGSKGNIWCSVDYETGQIVEAFSKAENADQLALITQHPTTNRDIIGFQIPYWAEIIKLSLNLAVIFSPQQFITWDIGVTPDGPIVIEGNLGAGHLPSPFRLPIQELLIKD